MRLRMRARQLLANLLRHGVLIVATMVSANLMAQEVAGLFSQKLRHNWTTQDGVPNYRIGTFAQTLDGMLWFSSQEGLTSFDGFEFKTHNRRNSPELWSSDVNALCVTPRGTLWIGTEKGLVGFTESRFSRWPRAQGEQGKTSQLLELGSIVSLKCFSDETVWVGTGNGTLIHFANGKPGTAKMVLERGKSAAVDFVQVEGEKTWVFTWRDGIYECNRDGCSGMQTPELKGRNIYWAKRLDEEHIALRIENSGLWVGKLGTTPSFWQVTILQSKESRPFVDDDLEQNHFGINGFIVSLNKDLHTATKLLELESWSEFEDRQGNLWVASRDQGLLRFSTPRIRMYGKNEGMPNATIFSVATGSDNKVYVASRSNQLMQIERGVATQVAAFPSQLGPLAASQSGVSVAAADGVYDWQNAKVTHDQTIGAPASPSIGVLFDRQERLWVGGHGAPIYRESGIWKSPRFETRFVDAGQFLQRKNGDILFSSKRDGLFLVQGDWVRPLPVNNALPGSLINAFFEDSNGVLWVASGEYGLYFLTADAYTPVRSELNLPNQIFSIIEDDAKNLWLCGSKAIYRAPMNELMDVSKNLSLNTGVVEIFDHSDGLRDTGCYQNSQPTATKTEDGTIWFATNNGVAEISPTATSLHVATSPLRFTSISVDDVDAKVDQKAELKDSNSSIKFSFSLVELRFQPKVEFFYRLIGLDEQWKPLKSERTIEFRGLKPATYRIEIGAKLFGKPRSSNALTHEFVVRPVFTETIWFYILMGVLLLLPFGTYFTMRMDAMHKVADGMRERAVLARELHDSLAQSFSGILMRLEVSKRMTPKAEHELQQQLQIIQDLARASLEEMRLVIARLKPDIVDSMCIEEVLEKQVATQMSRTDLKHEFGAFDKKHFAVPFVTHHIVRIVEQAISNCMLHSNSTLIKFSILESDDKLSIQIRDFGNSSHDRTIKLLSGGAGLRGMRERAEEIGGALSASEHPEGGYVVTLTLPVGRLTTNPVRQF